MTKHSESIGGHSDKDLLANTNKLLSLVGISAKQIMSIQELIRVSSSMFVAVFEALFRTRLEGIIRNPKDAQDYISNCQTIIDGLAHQLQIDLRHITGDSIFRGDRRALFNLVNILLRIANITSKDSNNAPGFNDVTKNIGFRSGKDSESISSHESAFPADEDRNVIFEDNLPDKLPLQEEHESELNIDTRQRHHSCDDMELWGMPCSPLVAAVGNKIEEGIDIGELRRSLSEFEQYKRIETARQRRENQLRMRASQASVRNQKNMEKSCQALQQQWLNENHRAECSELIRRSHEEDVMLRKIQNGLLKQMRMSVVDQNQEMKSKMKDIKQATKSHFQSLQRLFDDRVNMLRESEKEMKASSSTEMNSYRRLTLDLKNANRKKLREMARTQESILKQKREHAMFLRKGSHHQLVEMLSLEGDWADSLRTGSFRSTSRSGARTRKTKYNRQSGVRANNSNGSGRRRPQSASVPVGTRKMYRKN